jgi:septal ring factor EnvC (AmiA/AmiB activator)
LIKKLFLLLLACWFWAVPCTLQAAYYQMTEAELTRLEQIFQQLKINNNQLLTDLTKSRQNLTETQEALEKYQKDLTALEMDLLKLKTELIQARTDLETAKTSLEKANQSLEQDASEVKSKIRSLKFQRNAGYAAALLVLIKK